MKANLKVLSAEEINRKYYGSMSQESFLTYNALEIGYKIASIETPSSYTLSELEKIATAALNDLFEEDTLFIYFTDLTREGIAYFAFDDGTVL